MTAALRPLMNPSVVAVAYDGLCAFEFGVAAELFGLPRPELDTNWYDFGVISVDKGPLRSVGGITFQAPTDLGVVAAAGTVVLPGWRDPTETPPVDLLDAIREAHARGARIMSICSGVFILAATGLLDGLSATTHWRYTDRLAEIYPAIDVQPDVLYIDNGCTLTSAGSAAGIDLGIHLIRRDHGASVANEVARRLIVSPHRDGGQAQFITTPDVALGESPLAELVRWIVEHLDEPLTVADLSRQANIAPRTLARRFRGEMGVPPHTWLVRQRVMLAQRLLEDTDAPIDEVASRAGFGSPGTLRHHFTRETQTTPTRYRARFKTDLTDH